MKTTQLIDLLKKYECGAVTGRPREVYFEVGDEIIKTDGIEFIGAGDGLVTDLFLSLPYLDAVPVIRCKDCKHWEKTWTNDWAKDYHYCIMVDGVRKVDFYCADAERRNDED